MKLFDTNMAVCSAVSRIAIAKLNNLNYQTWKFKVDLLLIRDDLRSLVDDEQPELVTDEWREKDRKARATICLLLEDSQLHTVRTEPTAEAASNALKRYHEKSTLSSKLSLLKKICGLKLAEYGDMEIHLAQMEHLIEQLSSLGEALAKHLTVALYLSSLRTVTVHRLLL